jgi:hypothetical protein
LETFLVVSLISPLRQYTICVSLSKDNTCVVVLSQESETTQGLVFFFFNSFSHQPAVEMYGIIWLLPNIPLYHYCRTPESPLRATPPQVVNVGFTTRVPELPPVTRRVRHRQFVNLHWGIEDWVSKGGLMCERVVNIEVSHNLE